MRHILNPSEYVVTSHVLFYEIQDFYCLRILRMKAFHVLILVYDHVGDHYLSFGILASEVSHLNFTVFLFVYFLVCLFCPYPRSTCIIVEKHDPSCLKDRL